MCGIAGYIDFERGTSLEVLSAMTDSLLHRGPDARGIYEFRASEFHVGLGHRRLSILDLSSAGGQPMHRGSLSVVFNGEIYNFEEIQAELIQLGHTFRSHSDTEVILASYQQWGIEDSVRRFNGMFAFALLDETKQRFYLVRDRVGVKPLYVYSKGSLVLFASELKAFNEHSRFHKEICNRALTNFFRFGYVPPSQCIYRDVRQVSPAEIVTIDLKTGSSGTTRYWEPEKLFQGQPLQVTYSEGLKMLRESLIRAFEYRMVADVEVGVFLSGGFDSSVVSAILQNKPGRSLRTFTIGFRESEFDESDYASKIASHIGTRHTDLICDAKEAQEIIPQLPEIYDEPFGDSSAIPTILVSRLARKHLKVALSADGGDELFGGYNRYANWMELERKSHQFPSKLMGLMPLGFLKSLFGSSFPGLARMQFYANYHRRGATIEDQVLPMLVCGKESFLGELLRERYDSWFGLEQTCQIPRVQAGDGLGQLMQTDYFMYLPGDILTKVDRATMSASLEGREPLLDYQLAELAFRMPVDWKISSKQRKRVLKDLAFDYLPRDLLDRPKKGFSVPYFRWLKGDLKYLLDEHLSKNALLKFGILCPRTVGEIVARFLDGDPRVNVTIWNLLMFQMWCKRWL